MPRDDESYQIESEDASDESNTFFMPVFED